MPDDWKSAVETAFMGAAGDGVQFTGCDLFDKKNRFEVRYLKNGVQSAVSIRFHQKGVFDPLNLSQEASDLGKQASLRG